MDDIDTKPEDVPELESIMDPTARRVPVKLASSVEALYRELDKWRYTATVEAEYGDAVAEGTDVTLAHHGPRAGNPCPCLSRMDAGEADEVDVIGVSHVDLDTLGGILEVLGRRRPVKQYLRRWAHWWELAAYVDVYGAHRLEDYFSTAPIASVPKNRARIWAWWAWSREHRAPRPPQGEAIDVTEYVEEALQVLHDIVIEDRADLLEAGEAMRAAEAALERQSWIESVGKVAFRSKVDGAFVNTLYDHKGVIYLAIVGYDDSPDPPGGAVTLSFEREIPGLSVCNLLQEEWGPKAGGRSTIGGSPRGEPVGYADARAFAGRVAEAIAGVEVD